MSWAWATSPLALQLPLHGHRPGVAAAMVLVLVVCAAYVAWHLDPAYVICAALVASLFSGNWRSLHFPNSLPPDRLLMLTGIALVLVRAPAAADRPALRIRMVHVLLLLAGGVPLGLPAFSRTPSPSAALFPP